MTSLFFLLANYLKGSSPSGSSRSSLRTDTTAIEESVSMLDAWLELKGNNHKAWRLSRSSFVARFKVLLNSYDLNQGALDLCAFTSLLFACLRCYPKQTTQWAMELFDTGTGNLGGLSTPTNTTLRAVGQGDLIADDEKDSSLLKHPPFTDWILQTSIVAAVRSRQGIQYRGLKDQNSVVAMKFNLGSDETEFIFKLCPDFFGPPVVDKFDGESLQVNQSLEKSFAVILVIPAKFIKDSATSTHVVFLDSSFTTFQKDYNGNMVDWVRCFVHNYGTRTQLEIVKNSAPTLGDGISRIVHLKMK